MRWTTMKPKYEGYYWALLEYDLQEIVVEAVHMGGNMTFWQPGCEESLYSKEVLKWSDAPIPKPEEG